jgi:alpha/beta superfamily hydrolase
MGTNLLGVLSSPSVVLASHMQDGIHIIDDLREAYYWLRQNTPKDAVVVSWWDYGYQIAGMVDRSSARVWGIIPMKPFLTIIRLDEHPYPSLGTRVGGTGMGIEK